MYEKCLLCLLCALCIGNLESARLEYEEAMEVCQNENIKTAILDHMSAHPLDK